MAERLSKFSAALLSLSLAACAAGKASPPARPAPKQGPGPLSAHELHRRALVIDTHVDTPSLMYHQPYDIGRINDEGHVDLPRMRIGGLDAAFFAIWINPDKNPGKKAWTAARRMTKKVLAEIQRNKDRAQLVVTADQLKLMAIARKRAILLGVEGGHMLGGGPAKVQLDRLREFFVLGVRYLTLTWATDNDLGGSSWDGSVHKGLTPLGKHVIEEMNLMGMMVDVSHVSDQTLRDVLKVTKKPVIASHSATRALCDLKRNIPDDLLRGCCV